MLLCAVVAVLYACKPVFPGSDIMMDTSIDLWIRDSLGNNLLDSTTDNYYKASEIRVYKLVNESKIEMFNPALDAPRNFMIYKNTGNGEYLMRLFPYEGPRTENKPGRTDELATTYIKWRENKEDTVLCTITRIYTSMICTKVIYNGVLKYDDQTQKEVHFGDGFFHRFIAVTE